MVGITAGRGPDNVEVGMVTGGQEKTGNESKSGFDLRSYTIVLHAFDRIQRGYSTAWCLTGRDQ
jgi:hypothetical protein